MSAVVAVEDKKCPYCAELIKAEAVKCKHCREMLVKVAPIGQALPTPKPGQKASMMGLWLLLAPGVAILLLMGCSMQLIHQRSVLSELRRRQSSFVVNPWMMS